MDGPLFEQDFVIKFWAPIIETSFRQTSIVPRWGETIPGLLLANHLVPPDQVPTVLYPFCLITAFEFQLLTLRLGFDGLYFVDKVSTCWFPTTIHEVCNGGIQTVLQTINELVNLSNDVKIIQEKPTATSLSASDKMPPPLSAVTPMSWTRRMTFD
ncbi:hypothetical protein DM01DRAFT_1343982 [Hesseltinella vesiculosa]|uniref:Uncharacterized protein n=1 Tax=Hesseltinella vesiculosa TaxID=101127 RepID=A0A1X2GNS3_9FUNG|nr:hypothetical protein DM01DRAFT_1343982 [Hesseltinella vesiculosa]